MTKKLIILCASLLVATTAIAATKKETPRKKVLISQLIEHPALDATTKGIIEGLEKNGFKRGENLDLRVESAQANAGLAAQIAGKFVAQNPDIVVGVATVSAQSFAKYAIEGRVKLVFSTVTDPLGASLVQSLDRPGNNTSGVSNFIALEPQIKLFRELQPKLKRLGFLYNPGESNSVSLVKKLEELCPPLGLALVKQTVSKTADVPQAATKLANQVDAIFISNDNTSLGALQSIVQAANKVKIPVYVSDTDAVELGALAALGPNQYEVGLQTGAMIARSLRGDNLDTMPVEFPIKMDMVLNFAAAKSLGIAIPDDVRLRATRVIEKSTS